MSEAIKVQEFFRYRVEPYTDQEIPRCACCGKKMRVAFPKYVELIPEGSPEQTRAGSIRGEMKRESEFTTNNRIIWRKVEWGYAFDDQPNNLYHGKPDQYEGRPWHRVPYVVRLTFWNDQPHRWGADGIFCSGPCVSRFAHAAYRAGYRIVQKAA